MLKKSKKSKKAQKVKNRSPNITVTWKVKVVSSVNITHPPKNRTSNRSRAYFSHSSTPINFKFGHFHRLAGGHLAITFLGDPTNNMAVSAGQSSHLVSGKAPRIFKIFKIPFSVHALLDTTLNMVGRGTGQYCTVQKLFASAFRGNSHWNTLR